MSFLSGFTNGLKNKSEVRREKERINNLDWKGLENHLIEYHGYIMQNDSLIQLLADVKSYDTLEFEKVRGLFSDKEFGMNIDKTSYGMLYLGWSVGVGLIDEQFPEEKQELVNGIRDIEKMNDSFLTKKGINNEFVLNCFKMLRRKMYVVGKEHGGNPEFIEFRPRRLF